MTAWSVDLFVGFLMVPCIHLPKQELWAELGPPERYVVSVISETCECDLIWSRVFEDVIFLNEVILD